MFGDFKIGEERYAYPLARGIWEALCRRSEIEFDAIIPIPLSPDKAEAAELNRTLALARELERLCGAPVREFLKLAAPISKRRMLAAGYTLSDFERKYQQLLRVNEDVCGLQRVLLVDDTVTRGSTIRCALAGLQRVEPRMAVVVASAGRMIIKAAVANEVGFVTESG
jgi:predicted amidophosphoribosyltransferase